MNLKQNIEFFKKLSLLHANQTTRHRENRQ